MSHRLQSQGRQSMSRWGSQQALQESTSEQDFSWVLTVRYELLRLAGYMSKQSSHRTVQECH